MVNLNPGPKGPKRRGLRTLATAVALALLAVVVGCTKASVAPPVEGATTATAGGKAMSAPTARASAAPTPAPAAPWRDTIAGQPCNGAAAVLCDCPDGSEGTSVCEDEKLTPCDCPPPKKP